MQSLIIGYYPQKALNTPETTHRPYKAQEKQRPKNESLRPSQEKNKCTAPSRIVVYVHNGVLLSYQKQWPNEILKKMDASRDYHPE